MKSEARLSSRFLNKLTNRAKDPRIIQMLLSLNLQVSKRQPRFSCGLFDFDWKLLFAVSKIKTQ